MKPRHRLVSFDLDGTLFPSTSTCLELGRILGHVDQIRALEQAYAAGRISNSDVATADAAAYEGRTVSEIERHVLGIPLIAGFQQVVDELKSHGCHVLLVTVTWSFAARALAARYGLDGFAGAVMAEADGVLLGRVERHFEAGDKSRFVRAYAACHGIEMSECAAVGDSRSDLALFEAVGLPIALNASQDARAAARVVVDSLDLGDILEHLLW
jgi:phosphoserine phosphatase